MRPLFVDGTLRPGQPGFDELCLSNRVDVLGPAQVAGLLYDLGEYPGAVLWEGGRIIGDLIRPRDESLLFRLDAFEMFDAADVAGSEYIRVPSLTLDAPTSVWIYTYNWPVTDKPVIHSGDWTSRGI